ncbi:MAG: nucleotidyltransferase domain-containing protein [Helicobacteraceae bacterium]|nr:nucleotidyltransferase domain-containing protein [Helicobacteraceae bacterium]
MRLKTNEKEAIVQAVLAIDPHAKIWLFGSRADDNKKGGDIDIAILSHVIAGDIMQKIKVRRGICDKIGEQKIDILVSKSGEEAFFKLAQANGTALNE